MDDQLYRIVLRPAELPEGFEVTVLDAGVVDGTETRRSARLAAAAFLRSGRAVRHPGELWCVGAAVALHDLLLGGPRPLEEVEARLAAVTGRPLAALAAEPRLRASELRLADTLVSFELVGDAEGCDVALLAAAAQGYEVIHRAAGGQDPVGLRPLAMPRVGGGVGIGERAAS